MPITRAKLDEIALRHQRQMVRIFGELISRIRDGAELKTIEGYLAAGQINEIINYLNLDPVTWQPLEEAIRDAYKTGGLIASEQIGTISTELGIFTARFNMRSQRAERWLAESSSRMIAELLEDQRQMVRERLTQSLIQGQSPSTAALDLIGRVNPSTGKREGGFIGLTSRQAAWTVSAREELENLDPNYLTRELRDRRFDATVRKAIESGEPLDERFIDNAVNRYQARSEKYRGDVIARTESINALRAGQYEGIEQAIEDGSILGTEGKKIWDATGDLRTRPDHMLMDETAVALEDVYTLPDGSMLNYPGDSSLGAKADQTIQCRCANRYEIRWGARAKRLEGFR